MSLYIASLNSGSNGNCYYVGNEQDAVLIDAGISCRETEKRMRRMGLNLQRVKAIFISHEHSDHIKGVTLLSKKYQIPVYITPKTMQYGRLYIEEHLANSFVPHKGVSIGTLHVTSFPKFHDAYDPHSFMVSDGHRNIGVFTDIGAPCEHLIHYFGLCHAAFLEANYDEVMLEQGRYPWHLKNRIRGGHGHLSNRQALELFVKHRPAFMSHLLLSHLSKENNCPELVASLFGECAGNTNVIVASRHIESDIYRIGDGKSASEKSHMRTEQITLF